MADAFTSDDLLHGAGYGIEQAGFLLHDAVCLLNNNRSSSAVALAVFAREELGRADIYMEQRQNLLSGGSITAANLAKLSSDHTEKLRRGRGGVTLRLGPEHAAIMKPLFDGPRSPGYKQARETMDALIRQQAKRDPNTTHEKRMSALYVEPRRARSGWNRPSEITRDEAATVVSDIANDYSSAAMSWIMGTHIDPALSAAIAAWRGCPVFPAPTWPEDPKPQPRR